MCNYCKDHGQIEAECQALNEKNKKTKKIEHKGNIRGEVNFVDATSIVGSSVEFILNGPIIVSTTQNSD